MAVATGETGFWHPKAILVLGRLGTGWNQKTIEKKSSRPNSANATVHITSHSEKKVFFFKYEL